MAPADRASGALLFVSDVHLSPDRPATTERFLRFLEQRASAAKALYVLGDLFDYWIGDDDLDAADADPLGRRVVRAFSTLAKSGVSVSIMHGNRDFLLGEAFASAAGARLVPDPFRIEHAGDQVMLSHGDALCTDDAAYQAFRGQVRGSEWQQKFLSAPLTERRAIMRGLRERSEREKKIKPAMIMDVNADAVLALLRASGTRRLIHGHTHRPARHTLLVDGTPAERWVLPEWGERGGYIRLAAGACSLDPA